VTSAVINRVRPARRCQLHCRQMNVLTAGGPRPGRLASVQVGDLVVHNVEALVSERNELPMTLLGMSFLNHLEVQRRGRSLTLARRH
jgi:clan AA aspartic protease (TIGR02281 family)